VIAYKKLEDHFREIANFEHASGILNWDDATMMPSGSADVRASAMATLSVHIHALSTDPHIADWVAEAKSESLDEWQAANVREIEREFIMNAAIPADLIEALSTAASEGEQAWRSMREENNWQDFQPHLDRIFKLSREQGQALGDALDKSPYDALISIHQPGIETKDIDPIFADLKAFLPDVVRAAVEHQNAGGRSVTVPKGISIEKQRALGLATMEFLGFDFNRGRLDVSHHPFCGGAAGDVRLTTRYDEDNFLDSLQGVIHETGHALYEQNRPPAYLGQPVSEAMGMAIHESQSLFMEMQLGRGSQFIEYMAPLIRRHLAPDASPTDKQWSSAALYALSTHVEPGLIRVSADECTYPAHVILRYEMEQKLIAGSMDVADIPQAWDASMQALLGLSTTGDYKDGCMQDVHWASGDVGYFPTYTLGAIAAAQLKAALLRSVDDIDAQITGGDLTATMAWLKDNIWSQGSLYGMQDLMSRATGKTLDVQDFKNHLKARYLGE
jgi:carboxypeptidase Taq